MKQVSIPEKNRICEGCKRNIVGFGVVVRIHGQTKMFCDMGGCYREYHRKNEKATIEKARPSE